MVVIDEDDYEAHLAHFGTPRHSGRYPYGSGDNDSGLPRSASFVDIVKDMKRQGMSESDIARGLGIGTTDRDGTFRPSSTQLRAKITIENNKLKHEKMTTAQKLRDKGMSNGAIAEQMRTAGYDVKGESSIRALLAPGAKDRADVLLSTAEMLKTEVDQKKFVDVGTGVENYLGISKEKLGAAVAILKEQGYVVHPVPVQQLGTGKDTSVKVLAPPGTTWGDVRRNQDNIQQIRQFSEDGGKQYTAPKDPLSINPKRVGVTYKEDGGDKADGVIYVRPGVKDIDLGNNRYAQVRVKVGEGHFLKGMAVYKDDLPDGVDLMFNTNKSDTGNKLDAMKPLKDDPALPFGSIVRQIVDKPGNDGKVTSVMNIVNDQGDWAEWSRNLSSQMLSKQTPGLVKQQLDATHERRKADYDEIMALTNPTIKKRLLEEFATSADSAAVHLKAAALPRQATHVILPLTSIKPNEVFAPGYKDGETVVLIRYPHGGTFEIPELTVNNRGREGRKIIGATSSDAIGIHHKVAERLSGADFDGDTVLVIPNPPGNRNRVTVTPALEGLKNFDPQSYKLPEGVPSISADRKQRLMGDVSNLITDMTIKGASHEKIARAVRHSMVVIDAEKHGLDVGRSARDNGIADLKREYQGRSNAGASTLVSRKKKYEVLPEQQLRKASEGGPINPETGERIFTDTGRTRIAKTGERVPVTQRINLLDRTSDARTLVSGDGIGTPVERIYADHSNKLKGLANQARLSAAKTPPLRYSPSAKKVYASQVASLNAKLALAEMSRPRERQAQIVANAKVRARRQASPDLEKDQVRKIRFQELDLARARMGVGKEKIEIDQTEWDAIQAGAISNHRLSQILRNADIDVIRNFATPKPERLMSTADTERAQGMFARGFTRAEVAAQLGVSLTTLDTATSGS